MHVETRGKSGGGGVKWLLGGVFVFVCWSVSLQREKTQEARRQICLDHAPAVQARELGLLPSLLIRASLRLPHKYPPSSPLDACRLARADRKPFSLLCSSLRVFVRACLLAPAFLTAGHHEQRAVVPPRHFTCSERR